MFCAIVPQRRRDLFSFFFVFVALVNVFGVNAGAEEVNIIAFHVFVFDVLFFLPPSCDVWGCFVFVKQMMSNLRLCPNSSNTSLLAGLFTPRMLSWAARRAWHAFVWVITALLRLLSLMWLCLFLCLHFALRRLIMRCVVFLDCSDLYGACASCPPCVSRGSGV